MEESPSTSRMGDALSGYRRQASENLHSTSDRLKGAYGRFKVSKKMKLILSVIIVGILACAATIATTIAVTARKANKNEALPTETAVPTAATTTIQGTTTTQVPKSTEFPTAPELDTASTVPPPSNGSPALVLNNCVDNGMISLTFDDGPSTNVPAVLQVLNELNTKATFFVNAKNIADFTSPDSATASILKTIYDGGHQVGTHTMSHADLAKISRLQRWEQMRRNVIEFNLGRVHKENHWR